MENKEQNKAELILSLAHNLLNAVEELQKENNLLKNKNIGALSELAELNSEKNLLQAELATTQMELKRTKDMLNNEPNFGWCWYSVLEATPLDNKQVLVMTEDGSVYLKTYTPECGWRDEEIVWMSIPELRM